MRTKFFAFLFAVSLIFALFSPVQAQSSTYPVYIVESGDTLASIADRFSVSQDDLIAYNGISNPNVLAVGSQLIIPGLKGLQGVVTTSPVQLGESLKDLTIKYQIDQDLLMKLNHITSPGQIYAGSSLILPVVEDSKAKVPVSKLNTSQTFLEVAALNNTTTWNLLGQNNDENQFATLPGDVVYNSVSQNANQISAVDPKLTSVTISPLPLVQGKTFEITVVCPQAVTLSGTLNGSKLNFFSLDTNKQIALQGINAMADPGLAPFVLSGTYADGSTFSFEQSVLLTSGNYPTDDPLTVDPDTIDPKVTQPEEDEVDKLVAAATTTRYWSGKFTSPSYYKDITATFGDRRSYNDGAYKNFHSGIDFGGGVGLPIYAPAAGKVVFTGLLTVRGNATFIDHGWGIYSAYFHQSEIDVKVGDMVKPGDVIGKVGNTGRVNDANAFVGAGAHLHWEIWVNGQQVDPTDWLDNQYP